MSNTKSHKNNVEAVAPPKTKSEGVSTNKNQEKTKRLLTLPNLTFSPAFNVFALCLLLLTVFGGLRYFSANRQPAQIAFLEAANPNATGKGDARFTGTPSSPEVFSGEVYDTALRLRETGALGMAITLAVFADFSEKQSVPADLGRIWQIVEIRRLMPPDVRFHDGELSSPSSTFLVRYQSNPLRFEILSRPKPGVMSPALMLRFPLFSLDNKTITYFQSASVSRFDLPQAFAEPSAVVAAGWTMEQWRGELLPKDANALQTLAEEKRLLEALPNNP